MSATLEHQTPVNYIHFAIQNPAGMTANLYRDKLKALLSDPCDNGGKAFYDFKRAAQLNAKLSSTFYAAVCDAFKKLRDGISAPQRWDSRMAALSTMIENDPTLLKYARETLLAGAVAELTASHSSDNDLQVASDILSVAGTSPLLADVLRHEWMRPVVMWHLKKADHRLEIAAPTFAKLRLAKPFGPVIDVIEAKQKAHVESEVLPHDPNKNLVFKFTEAHEGDVTVFVVDLSKPSRAKHPHEISFDEAAAKYGPTAKIILERADAYQGQSWVSRIATERYCTIV